jgi:hypothetical protein
LLDFFFNIEWFRVTGDTSFIENPSAISEVKARNAKKTEYAAIYAFKFDPISVYLSDDRPERATRRNSPRCTD